MFRYVATVASLALVFSFAPRSVQAETLPRLENIGFVFYTKSSSPGTLNARWMSTDRSKGPGIATGGPRDGYAGKYHVRYFYESGEFSDEYELTIEKVDDVYRAYWQVDGETLAFGVGMDVGSGLAIGWRRLSK